MADSQSTGKSRMKFCPNTPPRVWITSFISAFSIVFCAFLLRRVELSIELRVAVALIPALPTAFLIWTMARAIIGLDELQRKIQLEGLALSFAVTIFLIVIYGMLQLAQIGLPEIPIFYVYVVMVLFYGIGTMIAGRRYR